MRDATHFPVVWVNARDILDTRSQAMLGICSYSKKVFAITNSLMPFVINDIIITGDDCEEAEGCLCVECPLNKTTAQSLAQRIGKEGKMLAAGIDFETRTPITCNRSNDNQRAYAALVARTPNGGSVSVEKRTRRKKRK